MRRRDFAKGIASAGVAWPLATRAQQPDRVRRLGVLTGLAEDDAEIQVRLAAFREELQKLGWTEGRDVQIEYRWGAGDVERMRAYAAELVALTPDVILAHSPPTVAALRQKTRTIPIVFVQVPDPVEAGVVASLAHPGGNITGFVHFERTIGGKWLEVLKEIAPRISKVMVFRSPNQVFVPYSSAMDVMAPSLGVQLTKADVRNAEEIKRALDALARDQDSGLLVPPDNFIAAHRALVIDLAARYRLPAVYPYRFFVKDGGLVSYGVDLVDLFRRAAVYVDRIFRGAKPADLPVQLPSKFELVINLKTAKVLGLTVPPKLLFTADEVIE